MSIDIPSIIPLRNGATVVEADLSVTVENDAREGRVEGFVLALVKHPGGVEWVTWLVWLDGDAYEATSGNYFHTNEVAATADYNARRGVKVGA